MTEADGSLSHTSTRAGELYFTFYGKWNQPVELLFQSSPQGGKAEVILDGNRQVINLRDSYTNNRVVPVTTGSTRPLWNILLPAADLAIIFVLALAVTGLLILLSNKPALAPLLNARKGCLPCCFTCSAPGLAAHISSRCASPTWWTCARWSIPTWSSGWFSGWSSWRLTQFSAWG